MCKNCERQESSIKFANLHCHTSFSVFDGFGLPKEHLEEAYKNGLDHLAITEHGHMNSLDKAEIHAKKMNAEGRKIKYIKGMEAYFIPSIEKWKEVHEQSKEKKSDDELNATIIEQEDRSVKDFLKERRHLTLLAKNKTGLHNLFQMVSKSHRRPYFYYYPRIDYEMLREHSEGLMATTSCVGGILMGEYWKRVDEEGNFDAKEVEDAMREVVKNMVDIFGDDFYGELQWNALDFQHILNKYVIKFSKEFDFPLISTCDSHYPTEDDWQNREMHRRIGNSWIIDKDGPVPSCKDMLDYELYPKNGDQIWESYRRYSKEVGYTYDDDLVKESIEFTYNLASDHIEDVHLDTEVKLPDFVVPEGKTADGAFEDLTRRKLHEKTLDLFPDYYDRMEHEMNVIKDQNFSKYFLTTKEITDEARKHMFVGPGRGSGGGSLVSYLLEISQVDPLKYGLQFERFLRKSSKEYPDIDIDFSHNLEMKEILIEKWGQNNAVSISNWNRLKLKSLIKDLARYYEIPYPEVNEVTGKMDEEAIGPAKKANGIKAGVYEPTYEEMKKYSPTLKAFLDKYPEINDYIDDLYNNVKSVGRHAGGLIVSEDLHKNMPLIASKGVIQSPWDKKYLEDFGFIKFDILGLKTLRFMEIAIEHILKRYEGIENPTFADIRKYYDENLHPDVIDFDDQEVYENIYHDGNWGATFQFQERGAQNYAMKVKPRSIEEISAVTAIQRPGPLASNVDKDYAAFRENPELVEYINDDYKEVTEDTYGLMIYQEQISELTHKLGKDISLEEGNVFMKILTKREVSGEKLKKKKEIKGRFLEGCLEKGMSKADAQELYDKMEWFSQYSFNKSHSVAYSIVSFQCAWLLNYYPECWLVGYLEGEDDEDKMAKAINTVRSLGYEVELPDVNISSDTWEISEDGTRFYQPLIQIKGIGDKTYEELIKYRPFNDIEDFLFHDEMRKSKVNKTAKERLAAVGALSSLQDDRFAGSKHFWQAIGKQNPSTPEELQVNIEDEELRELGDFSKEEKIKNFEEYTSVYPLHLVITDRIMKEIENVNMPAIGEWKDHRTKMIEEGRPDDIKDYCWFVPKKLEVKQDKNGRDYWQLEVIDSTYKVTKMKCWGISWKDKIKMNVPTYAKKIDYDPKWGFSTGWGNPPHENLVQFGDNKRAK